MHIAREKLYLVSITIDFISAQGILLDESFPYIWIAPTSARMLNSDIMHYFVYL